MEKRALRCSLSVTRGTVYYSNRNLNNTVTLPTNIIEFLIIGKAMQLLIKKSIIFVPIIFVEICTYRQTIEVVSRGAEKPKIRSKVIFALKKIQEFLRGRKLFFTKKLLYLGGTMVSM